MDVALAAVIVSGLAVVSSSAVALFVPRFTASKAAELARENRVQQRLAEAYLDVLRLTEREGLSLHAEVCNMVAAAVEDEYDPIPRLRVPAPEIADQAAVAALLAAFGSEQVIAAHAAWRASITPLDQALATLRWNAQESGDPDYRPEPKELQPIADAHAGELSARSHLADVIAAELGHRTVHRLTVATK